jgi:hypothetical protein
MSHFSETELPAMGVLGNSEHLTSKQQEEGTVQAFSVYVCFGVPRGRLRV